MFKTVVTTILLAGCSVGAVDGVGPANDAGGADPRSATFATDVVPIVTAQGCLNVSCHGGTQNPRLSTFNDMTTNGAPGRYLTTPATANILITKDAQTPGQHPTAGAGVLYLDTAGKTAITNWINSGP